MKKILALLLAVLMVFSMAACANNAASDQTDSSGDTADDSSNSSAPAEAAESFNDAGTDKYADVEAPSGFKIGFAYMPPSDTLSAAFHKVLDYTAEQFGCEMIYTEWTAYDAESILAGYENEVQAGADAVIGILVTGGFLEYMNKTETYWCVACHPLDDSLREQALADPYFCGDITEDDYLCGYQLAEKLYNAGCRQVGLMSSAPGDTTHDPRCRGFYDFIEEHPDMECIAEDRQSAGASATRFDEFVAAHGTKLDGIGLTGGNASLPAAIISAGFADSIKYAAIDIQGDVRTDLEDGLCVGVAGGQYPTTQLAFVMLYNALASDGAKVIDLTETLLRPMLWMDTVEDYDNYITYMEGDIPAYTGDELKELCLAYNPDATVESIQAQIEAYCESYSVDDIVSRHADLIAQEG